MKRRHLARLGLFAMAALALPALAPAQLPKLPRPPRIPGLNLPGNPLDALLKGEPPLTTSLKDAGPDVPPLDLMVSAEDAQSLLAQPRTESGAYKLKRGAYFADLQSY